MVRTIGGAWIAEWYHTWLWTSVYCTMPWAGILSLGDDQLFFGPKHSIYAFFMILFVLFDFILLFVCQICHVNCETEKFTINKIYLLKKVRTIAQQRLLTPLNPLVRSPGHEKLVSSKWFERTYKLLRQVGCGSVGRVVASDTTDLQFESSQRQKII